MIEIVLYSDEYGGATSEYTTWPEALAGLNRLYVDCEKAVTRDGITRELKVVITKKGLIE